MSFFSLIFRYKDKKSPDILGHYPVKVHVSPFPERRYLWSSRILVIIAVMSICFSIILTSVLYLLLPNITSKPAFYNINEKTSTLEKSQPAFVYSSYIDLITEGLIEEYIKIRHAIPKSSADLFYRWDRNSKFYWYSSSTIYSAFISKIDNHQLMNFIKQKMVRNVEIDYIKKIGKDFWIAQFTTSTSTKHMTTPDVIIWRAYIRIMFDAFKGYENLEKNEREKMNYTENPFGFKVIKYGLTYAGKPEKSYTALQTAKKVFESVEDIVK